ncbi:MAG: S1 RNA-binding domain-containing protein [Candidatus Nealsonbacteria bacterium]|nr:S1 RNA-binding domain-containing protein [Candidatus Nealsonbacteria bacterium]
MTNSDPIHPADPPESEPTSQPTPAQEDTASAAEAPQEQAESTAESNSEQTRRRILIGSQRDPGARPKRARDWTPITESDAEPQEKSGGPTRKSPEPAPSDTKTPAEQPSATIPSAVPSTVPSTVEPAPPTEASPTADASRRRPEPTTAVTAESPPADDWQSATAEMDRSAAAHSGGRVPLPNLREKLSPDLEDEFNQLVGDAPVEELMSGADALTSSTQLEPETQLTGRVVAVQREDIFVDLGGREQGCVSVRLFETPPEPGTTLDVVVQRFNSEEGLYDLTLPNAAISVDDWSDIHEGMRVDARITGHNTGGLECEVNRLRGFIPVSQIALYRVEDLAPFVDQKLTCMVTECRPERRNLVLSHRAVLEREQEEAREALLDSLELGQIYEGTVRKLMDFGAFVDIGGVDGLLHISQLSWGRVQHPRDVLSEGQTIKVKIEKFDRTTGKISFAYRDMLKSPWEDVAMKYLPNTEVDGTVTRLAEFGAFVELEPGVEGLIHISELAYKRIPRASDVVSEGEKIQVMVLSVDVEAQRISLSLKAMAPAPEPEKKQDEPGEPAPTKRRKHESNRPLTGGLGKPSGGEQFGLKW